MGKITILPETTKNPITLIGTRAGICWGADITDDKKNYKRGLECLKSNHGRTLEFVNIEAVIDGYSARVIREWYTHIGGSPTRLQASTRYIDYSDFGYVVPKTIKTEGQQAIYNKAMENIADFMCSLEKEGVAQEDIAMLLPLGMATKIVDKRNLRNVLDMAGQRECSRAYWEFRELFKDYKAALREISDEWKYIIDNKFKPKCEVLRYCPESKGCGRYPNLNV